MKNQESMKLIVVTKNLTVIEVDVKGYGQFVEEFMRISEDPIYNQSGFLKIMFAHNDGQGQAYTAEYTLSEITEEFITL